MEDDYEDPIGDFAMDAAQAASHFNDSALALVDKFCQNLTCLEQLGMMGASAS